MSHNVYLSEQLSHWSGNSKELTDGEVQGWMDAVAPFLGDYFYNPWFLEDEQTIMLLKTKFGLTKKLALSTSKSNPIVDGIDVDESKYIPRFTSMSGKTFPALYFSIGKQPNSVSQGSDKLIAQHFYLIDMIRSLFGKEPTSDNDLASLKSQIVKNRVICDRVAAIIGSRPKKLGMGADGVVYQVNDHQVIKFLTSRYAFEEAQKAFDRLHSNPELSKTEAMIYDLGKLIDFKDKRIFFILLEKMNPITEKPHSHETMRRVKMIVREIVDFVIHRPKLIDNVKSAMSSGDSLKIHKLISYALIELEPLVRESLGPVISKVEEDLDLRSSWLPSFIEEIIMKSATNRKDLHIGNLGVTYYGDLRYFDPAHEKNQHDYNEGALKSAHLLDKAMEFEKSASCWRDD
jgi:hypothetical protein